MAGRIPWNRGKKCMLILLVIGLAIGGAVFAWLQQPQYASPVVSREPQNPLFYDGQFHNQVVQPVLAGRQNVLVAWYRFIFTKVAGAVPEQPLPSVKTDLHQLDKNRNVVIWMGHSSYFIQLEGKRFLVDPVFSDNASPVPGTNRPFPGSNMYRAGDIPAIDYLLITHDHWDHLDYPTIDALRAKIGHIIAPTGVGSYFARWGFAPDDISEGGWFSRIDRDDLAIHILPAQHFSGRLLKRNQTLWASFALITAQHRLYLGGDSGYGAHFKAIGEQLGGLIWRSSSAGSTTPTGLTFI